MRGRSPRAQAGLFTRRRYNLLLLRVQIDGVTPRPMRNSAITTMRQQRFTLWVSRVMLLVMAMNLLAPTLLERLSRWTSSDITLSVCSSSGLRTLVSPADSGTDEQGLVHGKQHCALCALSQTWMPPVEHSVTPAYWVAASTRYPVTASTVKRTEPTWLSLPARAPPSSFSV